MPVPDTTLTLGDFLFAEHEIPSDIPFGGAQRMSVHELPGGVRVVDAMGRSDRDPQWSGYFLGSAALNRALYLDGLRAAGKPLTLTWSELNYQVLIKDFQATFRRKYEIPYQITLQVIADNTTPVTEAIAIPVDDQLVDDLDDSNTLATSIDDPTLTPLMATLSTAVNAVQTFANATQSTINGVLGPLAAVRAQIGIMIGSVDAAMGSSVGFGGISPSASSQIAVGSLNSQLGYATQMNSLLQLRGLCGRMAGNLNAINSSAQTIATAGGNLFAIAVQEYGDAMAWTGIAKANGLTDPFIEGSQMLTIPPQADNQDGVLGS